jgi:hypothetical protein
MYLNIYYYKAYFENVKILISTEEISIKCYLTQRILSSYSLNKSLNILYKPLYSVYTFNTSVSYLKWNKFMNYSGGIV